MSYEICPWCQTDIIWDEEIGREEMCPHCFNELKDYRSIELNENNNDEASSDFKIAGSEINEDMIDEETEKLLEKINEPQDLIDYESTVETYRKAQEDFLECVHCHEQMIYAGQQSFDKHQYKPSTPNGLLTPFLKAPYSVDVHICPVCFEVRHILSEKDRLEMIHKLK